MWKYNSVYRLQFNKDFTFADASKILPYLKELGIEAVYCSPILQPVSGSTHGYDVCDPTRLWDELGGGFEEFCSELKARGMGLLFDLVANHMAVSDENPWWKDVCEKGQESKFAHFFDIQWKEGKIASYRRFFDIDSLVALRVEEPDVFDAYHDLVFRLFDEGKIDGFRVDHPDGLYDPKGYFAKLKEKCDFVIAEKILEKEEKLPSWEVDGTVGYEFLNDLTHLYIDPHAEKAFTEIYERYIGQSCNVSDMLFEAKEMIAREYFANELNILGMSDELVALLAAFPVYRSYLPDDGKEHVKQAFAIANEKHPELDFSKLEKKFTGEFAKKFEQLSPPIMAKGLEDTVCYRYARFVASNEVGGDPARFGMSAEEFHKRNRKRKGLLTISTHDTKRSHDVRMRLAVLSEMPEKFEKELGKVKSSCDANMTMFLFQNLLGASPISSERFSAYCVKAAREAKLFSSWVDVNEKYENSLELDCDPKEFVQEIDVYGWQNTLSSIALFLGSPGIVDVYRGAETWDFSLVDPDNRRPITFGGDKCEKRELFRLGLSLRKNHPEIFTKGDYIPLKTSDPRVVAFARTLGDDMIVFAGGRFFSRGPIDATITLPNGNPMKIEKPYLIKSFVCRRSE